MIANKHSGEDPIDAVITWVDGDDPKHVRKRETILSSKFIEASLPIAAGRDPTRFKNNDEIRYCILLLRKFAPWIRTIFLVTDNQIPSFLDNDLRRSLGVQVVDHHEIFRGHEAALPTFNSCTIETAIWRIPALADRFLYLNDDFFIIQPVRPEDFFRDNRVVLRGRWKSIQHFGPARLRFSMILNYFSKRLLGITRAMSLLQQMKAAELAGARQQYYQSPHVPHPLHKRTIEQYFERNPAHFSENIRYRFRDAKQFVATFLGHHLEILAGNAELMPDDEAVMLCFNRDLRRTVRKKLRQLAEGKYRFLCTQSLEEAGEPERKSVIRFLDSRLAETHETNLSTQTKGVNGKYTSQR